MPILIAAVAVLGLAVGSFLNVVIHRVPRGESIVHPGSHCPGCGSAVRARHNVPVLGWIVLRGRCADCSAHISIRYPLVELTTAALFVAVAMRLRELGLLEALPAYLFFTSVGIALTAIDLDVMRLPNAIVYPAYAAMAVLLTGASVFDGSVEPLVRAAIGTTVMFGGYLALVLAYPAGMGLGDVKLAGVVGGALGFLSYPVLIVGAFAAFVIAGGGALLLVLVHRASGKTAVPFGPFMVVGALVAIFAGTGLSNAYLNLAQLS